MSGMGGGMKHKIRYQCNAKQKKSKLKHTKSWRHDNIFYYDLILLTFIVCDTTASTVRSSIFFIYFAWLSVFFLSSSYFHSVFVRMLRQLHAGKKRDACGDTSIKKITNLCLLTLSSLLWPGTVATHWNHNHIEGYFNAQAKIRLIKLPYVCSTHTVCVYEQDFDHKLIYSLSCIIRIECKLENLLQVCLCA